MAIGVYAHDCDNICICTAMHTMSLLSLSGDIRAELSNAVYAHECDNICICLATHTMSMLSLSGDIRAELSNEPQTKKVRNFRYLDNKVHF